MTRKRIRQIALILALLVMLALVGIAFLNYQKTRTLGLDIEFNQNELLPAPQYLYSFSGKGVDRLARPLGVLAESNRVLVTDAKRSVVDVFSSEGTRLGMWGKGRLAVPLYIAKNPKTGEYFVSDRRLRALVVFGPNGDFRRVFDPKLPKKERPSFESGDVQWAPVALDFAPDGSMYVTEILNGHRLLLFDAQGKFIKSVGTAGLVTDATQGEGSFQFPNSVKISGNEVWIADSNNRRVQVYGRNGDFKRIIVTQGLPRGFDFLPRKDKDPLRLVVIDTLAHDATIWDAAGGEKLLTFGTRGVLEGQFSYPNDTSVDSRSRIFIADTANGRVQVWGWPARAAVIPGPTTPMGWVLCLSPLALLPLLLLLRRRRFYATRDFVQSVYELGEFKLLPQRRVQWMLLADDHEAVRELEQDGVEAGTLFEVTEFSEADARAIQQRYELEWTDAVILAVAQRAKLFGTQNPELRRVARSMELNVVSAEEYVERMRDTKTPAAEESDDK